MKIEKADVKQFVPITITLESESDIDVMESIFASCPDALNAACCGTTADSIRECFSKESDNTAYTKLNNLRSR